MHPGTILLKSFKSTTNRDLFYNFMVNLTGNTVKYDSSAPCRHWCFSIFAKYFQLKCSRQPTPNSLAFFGIFQCEWKHKNKPYAQ